MIDLELRKKACAALGWTRFQSYGNGGGFWHRNGCEKHARNSSCECGGSWNLPAIEHDPAVSETMFLEWLGRKMVAHMTVFDMKTLVVVNLTSGGDLVCAVNGPDPSTARALAIVAASEKA